MNLAGRNLAQDKTRLLLKAEFLVDPETLVAPPAAEKQMTEVNQS